VQRSLAEILCGNLLSRPCTEILHRDLLQRACRMILYRDLLQRLAKRPLVETLVQGSCLKNFKDLLQCSWQETSLRDLVQGSCTEPIGRDAPQRSLSTYMGSSTGPSSDIRRSCARSFAGTCRCYPGHVLCNTVRGSLRGYAFCGQRRCPMLCRAQLRAWHETEGLCGLSVVVCFSVAFRWYVGGVLVALWKCLGDALVVFRWLSGISVVSRWYLGGVSVVSWWSLGCVL
jgi:hypothetical protein